MKKFLIAPLLSLIILISAVFLANSTKAEENHSIIIYGNGDLIDFSEKHGGTGKGNASSPLIISNLSFSSKEDPWVIVMEGVSLHVIFYNITINQSWRGIGIELMHCSNITFEDCRIYSNSTAIYLLLSDNISFISCKINGGSAGIIMEESNNILIESSSISSWTGIEIRNSSNIGVEGCKIFGCQYSGAYISSGEKIFFSKNLFYNCWIGVSISFSKGCYFLYNKFKDVDYISSVEYSSDTFFYLNSFQGWKGPWLENEGAIFRSPEEYKYRVCGKNYTGFLGNYWGVSGPPPTFRMSLGNCTVDPFSLAYQPQKYEILKKIETSNSHPGNPYKYLIVLIPASGAVALSIYFLLRRSSRRSPRSF